MPNYPGPLRLDAARSLFGLVALSDAAFTRDGPRAKGALSKLSRPRVVTVRR